MDRTTMLAAAAAGVLVLLAGCGGSSTPDDAGGDGGDASVSDLGRPDGGDAGSTCGADTQCDDGLFCTGTERCAPFTVGADAHGCVAGTAPCAAAMCMEAARTCAGGCPDNDGDGHHDVACGGDDCDDADPRRYPGNVEVCDLHDEDCDPATLGPDHDGDSFVATLCCNGTTCGTDCDDTRMTVHPGAVESCNGVDDDCNGLIDDGVLLTFYRDIDGDGYGRNDMPMMGCSLLTGYAFLGNDCVDDTTTPMSNAIHPGAMEVCDGIDNNCDGMTDPGCPCINGVVTACGDPAPSGSGFLSTGICTIGTQTCASDMLGPCVGATFHTAEICNMLDDDCDGVIDNGVDVECYVDGDNDTYAPSTATAQRLCPVADPARVAYGRCPVGYTARAPVDLLSTDCADVFNTVHPGGTEVCNGLDDDCNGTVDDGTGAPRTCYVDNDDDGFSPSTAGATTMCSCPPHTTTLAPTGVTTTDCDDGMMLIHPGAAEVCDATPAHDENCNGMINEGCACTPPETRGCPQPGVCHAGTQTCVSMGATAGFAACTISPTSETCNGMDDDCNGFVDDAFACIQGSSPPCMRTCGAATLMGVAACSLSCTLGACVATEQCNGCDDDANGVVDNGFACALGSAPACTTACGTSGTQPCNGTCTAYLACRASAETCNYCDDNLDGTWDDDRAVSSTHSASGTAGTPCVGLTSTLDAHCPFLDNSTSFDNGTIEEPATARVGWGQVTASSSLTLTDVADGLEPGGTVSIYLASGSGVTTRKVAMKWDVGTPDVVTVTTTILGTTTVVGTDTSRAWNNFTAGETQSNQLQIRYTTLATGVAQTAQFCIAAYCSPVYAIGGGAVFPLGTALRAGVNNDVSTPAGTGPYGVQIQAATPLFLSTQMSCP